MRWSHVFWGSPPSRFEHAIRQFFRWVFEIGKKQTTAGLSVAFPRNGEKYNPLIFVSLADSASFLVSAESPPPPSTSKTPELSHWALGTSLRLVIFCVAPSAVRFLRRNFSCFHQHYFTF